MAGPNIAIAGKRLAAGAAGRARLAWLLGLDDAPPGVCVDAAAWIADHVELAVALGEDTRIVFAIEAARPGVAAFLTMPHLLVYYCATQLPPWLDEIVRRRAPDRLDDLTIEKIAASLVEDPEFGKSNQPMPPSASEYRRLANHLDTWGSDDGWADFFAQGEIARGQLDSLRPVRSFSFVQHCDTECLQIAPFRIAPLPTLVDYPWEDRLRGPGWTSVDVQTKDGVPVSADAMTTTDLTERDVVMGNPQKLRDVIEHAVNRPGPDDRIIFFSNTCVPTVTGEDVESVVREFRKKTRLPILYLTVTPQSMTDVFRELFRGRRSLAESAAAVQPDPRAVNLIGFPVDRASRELTDLLGRFGVRVNCQIIPEIDVDRIDRMPAATLNVVRQNRLWDNLYGHLRAGAKIDVISPEAPYGLDGTRRWILAVLEALDAAAGFESAWRECVAEYESAWRAVQAEASHQRVGFVVRGEEVDYLTDSSRTWGIPLVRVLEEAGFGLDVLLKLHDRKSARTAANQVHMMFERPSRHTIRGFNSLGMMTDRLRAAECGAVFSHHVFDWRLTQAGKNRFSLQPFEMGVPGAVRTVRRLVDICRAPLVRRYHAYLQRTPEGLRRPANREEAP